MMGPAMVDAENPLGATPLADGRCRFLLWAPRPETVELHLLGDPPRLLPMPTIGNGYRELIVEGVGPGQQYFYRLNHSLDRPDPASGFQPQGIHGPSQVVRREFAWRDTASCDTAWRELPQADYVLYELHVGTFTSEGTFHSAIEWLDDLARLGVTAIELMPVAQFPGARNWGYDGVHPFAVQNTYGGPEGMKAFVDACHIRGLAVVLDVVYNHLGPEGNYLAEFGPYFSDRHHTPWGPALNFDGPESDEVRRFFIQNALTWVTEFHVDGLRLDAIHGIIDQSASPFLGELGAAVDNRASELNRTVMVIAESNTNDPRVIAPRSEGGYGLHAQWLDDFGLSLNALLTGQQESCYRDYLGLPNFSKSYHDGFILTGQYSHYRRRRHGTSSRGVAAEKFVAFLQNHDQVGNRQRGERLSHAVGFEKLKLGAAAMILSPYVPLLFMGEEYAETAPFHFFVSHLDPRLVESVRNGRLREMTRYQWLTEPADPGATATFELCVLNHALRREGNHQSLWSFYQELLRLRKDVPAIKHATRDQSETSFEEDQRLLISRRWVDGCEILLGLYFGNELRETSALRWLSSGGWRLVMDSAASKWGGPGSNLAAFTGGQTTSALLQPWSCVLFERTAIVG